MDGNAHLEEGKILHHLLQEVHSSNGFVEEDQREINNNEQVNSMIENYRNHVVKQQKKLSNGSSKIVNHIKQNRSYLPLDNYNEPTNASLMSHSQPCLYSVADQRMEQPPKNNFLHYQHSSDPREEAITVSNENDNGSKNMNDTVLLRHEIGFLKQQVDFLQKKTEKLKQLEDSYSRIEQEFEQVLSQREKHERLEKSALSKMEQLIQRLTHENEILHKDNQKLNTFICDQQQQLIGSQQKLSSIDGAESQQQQMVQLNMILNDLVPKNKELVAIEERQRIELDAQRTTLEEQRTHIDMLEKALSNAQERLLAKDRQAMDAVAVMDKCAHLQKLLQESLDEKQKRQDEYTKQKAQLEMELAQLRLQVAKDASTFGPRKGAKSPENEEIMKLKKTVYTKDERISQLESSLLNIQKRYNEELQRNNSDSTNVLHKKLHVLETENVEKERRIQELLDEKQRIHGQWAEERRSLDHRVRLLEQDLRILMVGSNGALSATQGGIIGGGNLTSAGSNTCINAGNCGSGNAGTCYYHHHHNHNAYRSPLFYGEGTSACSRSNSGGYGMEGESCVSSTTDAGYMVGASATGASDGVIFRQRSSAELPTSTRAAIIHDSTIARMEELRRKIAERRASAVSCASSNGSFAGRSGSNHMARENKKNYFDGDRNSDKSRNGSSLSLADNISIQHVGEKAVQAQLSMSYYPCQELKQSPRSSSRMSSHMPEHFTSYIESLPPPARRRFAASERVLLRNPPMLGPEINSDSNTQNSSSTSACSSTSSRHRSAVIGVGLSGDQTHHFSDFNEKNTNNSGKENCQIESAENIVEINGSMATAENDEKKPEKLVFARKMLQKSARGSNGNIINASGSGPQVVTAEGSGSSPNSSLPPTSSFKQRGTVKEISRENSLIARSPSALSTENSIKSPKEQSVKTRRSSLGSFFPFSSSTKN